MGNINTWMLADKSLNEKVAVMLLYVLESSGSSPGRQGFFMVVNARGDMEGSIGGGIMEHKFVERTKKSLESIPDSYRDESQEWGHSIKKQFHDKQAAKDQSGMICSGEQTILFYPMKEQDREAVKDIIASLANNKNGTLILSPEGIRFDPAIPKRDFDYTFKSEDDWLYKEKTGYKNQLSVIGGGHCCLAFSKLMRSMDFKIRVYDDRKELKTMVENEAAHEICFVDDYTELKELIHPGDNHYVVIMTFGYRTDDTALRALAGKQFKYLGLLGSKSKVEKMFDDYRKEGVSEEWLQRIHTPVGLAIKSQTPEEIAVSIAAEIIEIKNKNL